MDYSLPGSSVHGILQARILEWVAVFFPRRSSNPGIKPGSPALQLDYLPSESFENIILILHKLLQNIKEELLPTHSTVRSQSCPDSKPLQKREREKRKLQIISMRSTDAKIFKI